MGVLIGFGLIVVTSLCYRRMQTLRAEIAILKAQLATQSTEQVFAGRLEQVLRESERHQFSMAVLYVDIDDFKVINQAFGAAVGDALLQAVYDRLHECIRQVDTVSRSHQDVFIVMLTKLMKPETAVLVVQRILQALALPFGIQGQEITITACIGVALYPSDGKDVTNLLSNAEYALKQAKSAGKQSYRFYQQKMHEQSQREITLYTSLSQDITFQLFTLHYPMVRDVATDAIYSIDVRYHWQHPSLGLIDAQELFSYAERQRKDNSLTLWLLAKGCQQLLSWREAGRAPARLSLAVTVKQLQNTQFIYQISQTLQQLSFDPKGLLLQIQGNFSELSLDVLEKSFNRLQYLGVDIGLDHFGANVFALRHLKNTAIRHVRLDPSLIDDVVTNEQTQRLITAILSMAKTLSLSLVIQGVDTEQQLATLRQLGATLMTGVALEERHSDAVV